MTVAVGESVAQMEELTQAIRNHEKQVIALKREEEKHQTEIRKLMDRVAAVATRGAAALPANSADNTTKNEKQAPAPKAAKRPSKKIDAKTAKKTVRKVRMRSENSEGNRLLEAELQEKIWDLLAQPVDSHRKLLVNYPDDGQGLTVAEIKILLESQGGSYIDTEIQTCTQALRTAGLLDRNVHRRYSIVEGQTFRHVPRESE